MWVASREDGCGVVLHENHEDSEQQESEMDESGEESFGDDPVSDSGADIEGTRARVDGCLSSPSGGVALAQEQNPLEQPNALVTAQKLDDLAERFRDTLAAQLTMMTTTLTSQLDPMAEQVRPG